MRWEETTNSLIIIGAVLEVLLIMESFNNMQNNEMNNNLVEMKMEGFSMSPFINDSSEGLFESINLSNAEAGDVLVYCGDYKCNNLVAHMLIEKGDNNFTMQGLNNTFTESVPIEMFKFKLIGIKNNFTFNSQCELIEKTRKEEKNI